LHIDTTSEDLHDFLTVAGMKDVQCTKLVPKNGKVFRTAAFRVSCSEDSQDVFYDENIAAFSGTGYSGIRLQMNRSVQCKLILTMVQVNSAGVRLCSYNMHGFNIGNVCLCDLCDMSDVVLIQEHWLP